VYRHAKLLHRHLTAVLLFRSSVHVGFSAGRNSTTKTKAFLYLYSIWCYWSRVTCDIHNMKMKNGANLDILAQSILACSSMSLGKKYFKELVIKISVLGKGLGVVTRWANLLNKITTKTGWFLIRKNDIKGTVSRELFVRLWLGRIV